MWWMVAAAGGGGGAQEAERSSEKRGRQVQVRRWLYLPYRLYHTNIAFEWYVKEGRYFSTHTSPRRTSYKSMDIPIPPWIRSLEDF